MLLNKHFWLLSMLKIVIKKNITILKLLKLTSSQTILCQYANSRKDQSDQLAVLSPLCSEYSTNAKQWWLSNRLNLLINNEGPWFQHASCSLPLIAALKALYKSVVRGREKRALNESERDRPGSGHSHAAGRSRVMPADQWVNEVLKGSLS